MLISVCICTYQRPVLLRGLLEELAKQCTEGCFEFEIIIVDNDAETSARDVVAEIKTRVPFSITYATEPRRSISYARNKSLACARGELIAFIDDDEFPEHNWLLKHFNAWKEHKVAGVLGPVRPFFEQGTPAWVKKGGFYNRPEHETGFVMHWTECRTGNVLLDRKIIAGLDPVFSPEFGTGGSDVDFFRRQMANGHKFIWCNEAVVHEHVPLKRCKRTVLMSRALLRGRNSFRHPERRVKNVLKAMVAAPTYIVVMPFLQLAGHHLFMRYLIKTCDHVGRLLAACGVHPIKQREM
jgi:succinoglycan biosynthesis protein ExoM